MISGSAGAISAPSLVAGTRHAYATIEPNDSTYSSAAI